VALGQRHLDRRLFLGRLVYAWAGAVPVRFCSRDRFEAVRFSFTSC
jgi:hypothetical protein